MNKGRLFLCTQEMAEEQDYYERISLLILFGNRDAPGCTRRPVTSVGHQGGRRVFWEGSKF